MDFPLFQVPYIGNGMTIALVAVLHVVLSHGIAIGAMLLIAIAEWIGYRSGSRDWEDLAKTMIKPTVILITAVGAITGVGIWFITTALAPRGIGSMLRIFFWPWFIEWIVFIAEVIVILVYYFTWDSWNSGKRKRYHVILGLSYPVLSFTSAFLITGILGFMLTPDTWPQDGTLWSAFFNPSFIPQLILRLSWGILLGTLYVISFLLFTKQRPAFRMETIRFHALIGLFSLVTALAAAKWYFTVVPSSFVSFAVYSVLTGKFSQYYEAFWLINGIAALTLIAFYILAIMRSSWSKFLLIPSIVIAIMFVAQYERIREFIRGPYLLPGYMYANQILLAENPMLIQHGAFSNEFWHTSALPESNLLSDGAFMFSRNCGQCHTIGGINSIVDRLDGRPKDAINVLIKHTQDMVPFMPPFAGSERDRQVLTEFLDTLVNHSEVKSVPTFFTGISLRRSRQ